MKRRDAAAFREILELPPGATRGDIVGAYLRLKELYSGDSPVLGPAGDDLTDQRRRKILRDIEDAYEGLIGGERQDSPALAAEPAAEPEPAPEPAQGPGPARVPKPMPPPRPEFVPIRESPSSGAPSAETPLASARRLKAKEQAEAARALRIRTELLADLENERFDRLPQEIYIRAHVRAYADYLGLDPSASAEAYVRRYRAWKARPGAGRPGPPCVNRRAV